MRNYRHATIIAAPHALMARPIWSRRSLQRPSRRAATTACWTLSDPPRLSFRPKAAQARKYKTPELNLFYADIVPNLTGRMTHEAAWLDDGNVRKPAEPLPPPVAVADAPIYRPTGEPDPVQ